VFSLTPTKPLIAGEGGLITTNDDELAHRCRIGRDYGNPGDYDCEFIGLNARMSEFHAAVALASLDTLDERIEQRRAVAAMYRRRLSHVEAVSFPELRAGDQSTYKDFTVLLAPGVDRAAVADRLAASAIETRTYYHPPVHRQKAYAQNERESPSCLPVTDDVAGRVLTLPLWETMDTGTVDAVCSALEESLAEAAASV
jgi:dTDP-4-amino-4,6-dideoxygalactose transaminase